MHPLVLTPNDRKARSDHEKDILSKWPVIPLAPTLYKNVKNLNEQHRARLLHLWKIWSGQPPTSPPEPRLRQVLLQMKTLHDVQYFIFFPVGKLPTEIITNIFRFVVWSTYTPDESVNTRVALTHVCRQWRAIALADHTLWSAIWFRDKFPYTRSLTFIERAGQAPLDIRINDTSEAEALTDAQMNQLLDRLFQKVGTIRLFIMLCYHWEPILTVIKRLHQALRVGTPMLLQRFELHRLGDPYLWPGPAFTPVGHPVTRYPMIGGPMVPRLTYVSVNGIHFDWRASTIHDLTTIDIRRLPLNHALESSVFRSMLINCPRLEKLALDGAGPDGLPIERGVQAAPIELTNLRILVLANFTSSYVQGVVAHFTAPNVLDLTIMNLFGHEYTELYVSLKGRFPKVRIFTMYALQVSRQGHTAMIGFLGSMTEVRYIRMAVLDPFALSTFMYDPKTLVPHRGLPSYARDLFRNSEAPRFALTDRLDEGRKKDPQPKTFVFPHLAVAEVQSISKQWVETWLVSRKALGLPLHTVYLQGDLAKCTKEDIARLGAHVSKVAIIGVGQKTPEEQLSLS